MIKISLCSSLPLPQPLPFRFFPRFSSFSKCCWLSTWAEEEVRAEETNAGCHIAGVAWDGQGSPASCPAASGRRDCPAHGSPRHAGATRVMLVSAAQKKSLYFEEKTSLPILLVRCRGGSRAAKCFPTRTPVTAWSQCLAWDISQRNSCRRLGFEVEKGSGDQAVETNNVPGQQNRQWSWRGQDYCCHSLLT